MATKKKPVAKKAPTGRQSPKLTALEIVPVGDAWQVVMRIKVPGKGGAPRKIAPERTFRTLDKAQRTAELLRRSIGTAEGFTLTVEE